MTHPSAAAVATPPERPLGFITALGVGQICSWGSLYYSFPLIAESMHADLGWSKPSLYGAATLGLIATALSAYPIGIAIDRGYGRRIMGGASILAGCFLLLWSQVTSIALFYLAVTALGALQAALLYEPAFAVIARRIGSTHARSAITTLTLWGGFASTVFIPLVQWLLDLWGWREALVVLAAINAFLCAAAYLIFIRPELDIAEQDKVSKGAKKEQNKQAVRHALRQPVFWALLASLTTYAAVFSAFTFHMYPLLLERGLTTTSVVQAIALIGPAQVAGRIALGMFARRVPVRLVGAIISMIFPLVFGALLLMPPGFTTVAIICIAYGAINGIFTIVRGMVVPEMLSRHAYGAINGLITVPFFAAKAAAPLGAAALWTIANSYHNVLYAIVAGSCILAVSFMVAAVLSRPRKAVQAD